MTTVDPTNKNIYLSKKTPGAIHEFILKDPNHEALLGRQSDGRIQHMNTILPNFPPWKTMEIMITMGCPLSCYHCITNSSPKRIGETMDRSLLMDLIDAAAKFERTHFVGFYGGEPMNEKELLREGIERVLSHGMEPSVVTSAFWATSLEQAREEVKILKGISQLVISSDRAHEKQVDGYAAVNGARAAREAGIKTTINYAAEADQFANPEHIPDWVEEAVVKHDLSVVVSPVLDTGRAVLRRAIIPDLPVNTPCGQLQIPNVDVHGNFFGCCSGFAIPNEGNSPFRLGRFPEQSIEEMFERAFASDTLNTIREKGALNAAKKMAVGHPERELELKDKPPTSPCSACQLMAKWRAPGEEFWTHREVELPVAAEH